MQERVWQKRGEQYLLIESPPASGKSRALMFVAQDKLVNQNLKQAIIAVPERTIGAGFDVGHEVLERRAVYVSAGVPAIIAVIRQALPALVNLALDVRLAVRVRPPTLLLADLRGIHYFCIL